MELVWNIPHQFHCAIAGPAHGGCHIPQFYPEWNWCGIFSSIPIWINSNLEYIFLCRGRVAPWLGGPRQLGWYTGPGGWCHHTPPLSPLRPLKQQRYGTWGRIWFLVFSGGDGPHPSSSWLEYGCVRNGLFYAFGTKRSDLHCHRGP